MTEAEILTAALRDVEMLPFILQWELWRREEFNGVCAEDKAARIGDPNMERTRVVYRVQHALHHKLAPLAPLVLVIIAVIAADLLLVPEQLQQLQADCDVVVIAMVIAIVAMAVAVISMVIAVADVIVVIMAVGPEQLQQL